MTDYPSDLDVRPLTTWPGDLTPFERRQRSPFSAPLGSTLEALRRELRALGARNPILEVAIEPDQFRIDGRPRANAREIHPGVVLSLPKTTVGALRYATDTFDKWQDNLRAIALGLEALRKVDRYGITRRGEQYAGWRQLPAGVGPGEVPTFDTTDDAARYLAALANDNGLTVTPEQIMENAAQLRRAWLVVARVLHPDTGGSTAAFQRGEAAKRMVDADQKQKGVA